MKTTRVAIIVIALGAACAAGFVTANSPAATQRCRLSSAKKLDGHVSLTLHESATGVIPGTQHSITISFSRQATDIGVHLARLRTRVPGYYGFVGGARGGSFTVHDAYTTDDGKSDGTMTDTGPVHGLPAGIFGHPNTCTYQLSVGFWTQTHFSGNFDNSGYTTRISDSLLTRTRKVPASGKLAGSALVPVDSDGCGIDYGSAGCVGYFGGWSNDFTMFKECGTTSAGTCPSAEDTDFGEATISWSLSTG